MNGSREFEDEQRKLVALRKEKAEVCVEHSLESTVSNVLNSKRSGHRRRPKNSCRRSDTSDSRFASAPISPLKYKHALT